MRVFPKRYDLLLTHLIAVLTERQGSGGAGAIVEAAARRLAEQESTRLSGVDGQDRWQRLMEWLDAEFSWQADVAEQAGDTRRLTIHQCPFQDLSKTQPDVRGVFFGTLIRALCADAVVEHAGAATGPTCCAFVVSLPPSEPAAMYSPTAIAFQHFGRRSFISVLAGQRNYPIATRSRGQPGH